MNKTQSDIKEVPYARRYMVTTNGNVISKETHYKNQFGDTLKIRPQHIMKQRLDSNGRYLLVDIIYDDDNKRHTCLVHKIIMNVFEPNKSDFKSMPWEDRNEINLNTLQINHKDEITTNNKIDNLEWCTPAYNAHYGRRLNKIIDVKKKRGSIKKIYQYTMDGELYKIYASIKDVIKTTNYTGTQVWKAIHGYAYKSRKPKHTYRGYFWFNDDTIQYKDDIMTREDGYNNENER